MKNRILCFLVVALATAAALPASAQNNDSAQPIYDPMRGELSPGTQAPTVDVMVSTLRSGSSSAIFATLEYGELVQCQECVPLLQEKILTSTDARTREIAAWWLRRRPVGFAPVMHYFREIAKSDPDAVRRTRAVEALGEFMDFHALDVLESAMRTDGNIEVRRTAVLAIARINAPAGNTMIAAALTDGDATVRRAAISTVTRLNFFRENDSVVASLLDQDAQVRMMAARACAHLHIDAAVAPLAGLLRGDSNAQVRQAAAWALGRLGGATARVALAERQALETESLVGDAIRVALRM